MKHGARRLCVLQVGAKIAWRSPAQEECEPAHRPDEVIWPVPGHGSIQRRAEDQATGSYDPPVGSSPQHDNHDG